PLPESHQSLLAGLCAVATQIASEVGLLIRMANNAFDTDVVPRHEFCEMNRSTTRAAEQRGSTRAFASNMNSSESFDDYVQHPRYGKGPHFTSLDPNPMEQSVHLHLNATNWRETAIRYRQLVGEEFPLTDLFSHLPKEATHRIPGTAITA